MKKKFLSLLLVLSMLCSFMPVIVSADTSGISTLVNYITKYGTSTSDGTGKKIKDTTTSGNTTFVGEIIYSSSKNTIDFRYTSSEAGMMANIGFTYNLTTNSCGYLIGLVQIYSSATATTPSQTYGCVSYDFNMKTYNKNTTLTFKSLDSGVIQSIVNTLNSQMNSLMKLGAISWDLMCIDAGTYLNRIGFDSYNVSSTPTPIPTYTISYNANGGTGAPSNQMAQSGNYITISSQIPTRKGYDFLGWSTSKTSQTATYTSGDYMKVTTNTTLYAVWQKTPMPDTTGNKITISNVKTSGNIVSFTSELSSKGEIQGVIIAAVYDVNGILLDTQSYSAADNLNISLTKEDNYDTAKIFWWFDTDSMYPMADCVEVDLEEKIYTITKEYDNNLGTVTITDNENEITEATEGKQVIIEISPMNGYGALTTKVTDENGNIIKIINNTFTMPQGNVKVDVTFAIVKDSGTCGKNNNLTWMLYDNGTLTISGSGQMQDFTANGMPWNKYRSDIKKIVVENDVSKIGNRAFYGCSNLEEITLPFIGEAPDASDGYNEVLGYIFGYYKSSSYIDSSIETIQYEGYEMIDLVHHITPYYYYIPSTLKKINITNVTTIPNYAFQNCKNLISITIPDSVTNIGYKAFNGCNSLVTVFYTGSEDEWIDISIDSGNDYLKKAKIVYNYVPEE